MSGTSPSSSTSSVTPVAAEQLPFTPPRGATELILVRHGASAAAVEGTPFPLLDGRSDPGLSEAGRRQALALAERLGTEAPARIFATPLRRTQETAQPLAASTGISVEVVHELAEVRLGEWEGGEYRLRAARGDATFKRIFEEERWDVIPGGESASSLAQRVRTGLEAIVEASGPDSVAVVVSHGGVIGEACRQATESRPFAFVHVDNAAISRLVVTRGGSWLLRSFNDVSHL